MLFVKLFLISFLNFKNLNGIIETCSGWRLNKYPVLKQFIKGTNGAKLYDKLKISFVPGHNPDLITTHPLKRTDLTVYKSIDSLHDLFIYNGFLPKNDYKYDLCKIWMDYKMCINHKKIIESVCNVKCRRRELWTNKLYERLLVIWRQQAVM